MPPLILSLKLDQASFDALEVLRQQYFPRARNFLSAHVTLFHQLPGEQETQIKQIFSNLPSPMPGTEKAKRRKQISEAEKKENRPWAGFLRPSPAHPEPWYKTFFKMDRAK